MKTIEFLYNLPQELIAQTPIEPRDSSRLLVYNRADDSIKHRHFNDIIDFLTPNDVLVINSSKVIPARLFCHREGKDENLEVLLLKRLDLCSFEALVRPGKKFCEGRILIFSENLSATICGIGDEGTRILKFAIKTGTLENEFDRIGEMPLPPYIKTKLEEKSRYQTVYARQEGSSAAPTAGLHFTPQLIAKIREMGVQIEEITLHVGLGTFRPVKVENLEEHKMHSEDYEIDESTSARLNEAKKMGKRIIAIGTTSVRTLESACKNGVIESGRNTTKIFIYPPYKFKFVDALVTNFHLPESTLLMLVSAFMGKNNLKRAYADAIKERYRFFSFGDAMFII